MRDRLDLPLEFCRQRKGYRYTEEVNNFPTLQITEGELFALLVAEKALHNIAARTLSVRSSAPSKKWPPGCPTPFR